MLLSIDEKILDRRGQRQGMDIFDIFLSDLFPNRPSAERHQRQRFGRDAAQIFTSHFRVSPDDVDDGIEGLSLQSVEGDAEIFVLHHKRQRTRVHV